MASKSYSDEEKYQWVMQGLEIIEQVGSSSEVLEFDDRFPIQRVICSFWSGLDGFTYVIHSLTGLNHSLIIKNIYGFS